MPTEFYKEYLHLLGLLITKTCNCSLLTGKFPDKLLYYIIKAGNRMFLVTIVPCRFCQALERFWEKWQVSSYSAVVRVIQCYVTSSVGSEHTDPLNWLVKMKFVI